MLAPGEKIETVAANRPHGEFSPFAHEMLRGVAAALGVSETQVHKDLSSANYSSIRAGLVEAEKTFNRRCVEFRPQHRRPGARLLDARGARDERPAAAQGRAGLHRGAHGLCRRPLAGPAAGWVDPVAERQGVVLGLDAGLTTLEDECARQGLDFEEVIDQRIYEVGRFNERQPAAAQWAGEKVTAMEAAQKPQAA
jgi:capsid protein